MSVLAQQWTVADRADGSANGGRPPVLLWLGVGALVLALLQLPRSVMPGERRRTAASAAWLVAGIVAYVVVPVLLSR